MTPKKKPGHYYLVNRDIIKHTKKLESITSSMANQQIKVTEYLNDARQEMLKIKSDVEIKKIEREKHEMVA